MPASTPKRQGNPRTTPAFAPAAVSITLLGPGVTAATKAKTRNEYACSGLIAALYYGEDLPVKNVAADARDAPPFARPVGLDVGRVKEEGAVQHRRVAAVVNLVCDFLRAAPGVALRLGKEVHRSP